MLALTNFITMDIDEDKAKNFEVIRHKIETLKQVIDDMDTQTISELHISQMHAVDKHIFEIMKILEGY